MARKVSAQAAPVPAALERLAKLTASGAAPDRVTRETEAVLADWREEALAPTTLIERLELLRDDLEAGLDSAVEQAGDVSRDDVAGFRNAARVVDGLRGAWSAVCAALAKR